MKIVYVVSPDFLESIFTESKKYSFELQGYGNFRQASKGLVFVNVMDILGFCYVTEKIPEVGSEVFEEFLHFAKLCDMLESNKKFIIMTKEPLPNLNGRLKQFKNLRFISSIPGQDFTDTVFDRNLFGSILLDNYEPYQLDSGKTTDEPVSYRCKTLSFRQIIPDCLYDIFDSIHILGMNEAESDTDKNNAIKEDHIVIKYASGNPLIARMRTIWVKRRYGIDYSAEKESVLKEIMRMPPKLYGLYMAVLKMIEVKEYEVK